jgi:AcrR family transcriptional regulator
MLRAPRPRSRRNPAHPTREKLIATVLAFLDERRFDEIGVDEVLERSGVSKGSLYHHFENLNDLIEQAMARRFTAGVEQSIEMIRETMSITTSKKDFFAGLRAITQVVSDPERAGIRFDRTRTLGATETSPRLMEVVATEQQRVNGLLAEIVADAQARGWVDRSVDPGAVALFVQAYTLGWLLNDVSGQPVSIDTWTGMIGRVLERSFAAS